MGELKDYFKDKYSRSGNKSVMQDSMAKQRIKNSIVSVCEKYLHEAGAQFTFEVTDRDLPYALAVIDEEPLRSRYNIIQTGSNLLCASLKEIDVEDIFE